MEFNEVIKSRRSIRRFKSDPIPDSAINEIMDAARLAPSGLNLQSGRYIVVKDPSVRKEISQTTPSHFISTAPVIIVCCMDTKAFETTGARIKELADIGAFVGTSFEKYNSEDFFANVDPFLLKANLMLNGTIAVENILLKATDLGLGSCWIATFDQEKLKKIVGLEDRYEILTILPIGYPDQNPGPRPRLPLNEIILKEI
ncbi:MAG: nitroreductase family protein [Clostridia bacterium]|nr:nitroreductase family protein [Clostridia bacterium]